MHEMLSCGWNPEDILASNLTQNVLEGYVKVTYKNKPTGDG